MKPFAEHFYKGRRWQGVRESYIMERIMLDGGVCELCHENLGYIVHHKIHITPNNIYDDDITLGFDNLQYVCKECHDNLDGHGVHNKGLPKRVMFTEDGDVIPIRSETDVHM